MQTFKIEGEYIQLNQLLKAMGWCFNGAEANQLIENGLINVNGEIEFRKRNKLYKGARVEFDNMMCIIE